MDLSAVLSVAFYIATLTAPVSSRDNYARGHDNNAALEDKSGRSREINESEEHEPKDFKGVFTRSMRKVQRQVRSRHNYYRRRHNAEPLERDDDLDRYAQAWAYHLATIGKVMHRRRKPYGENIYEGHYDEDHPITGNDAVDVWYKEVEHYDFNKNHRQKGTKEFTQVVWKDTSALGTGIARGTNGTYYLVTAYDPKGNVRGEYLKNVAKPTEEEEATEETRPKSIPKPEPAPTPALTPTFTPTAIPTPTPSSGTERKIVNKAGQPLVQLHGCPGKKPLTFKLNIGPSK